MATFITSANLVFSKVIVPGEFLAGEGGGVLLEVSALAVFDLVGSVRCLIASLRCILRLYAAS